MKKITNWRKATVADLEANGLLDIATYLHTLNFKMEGKPESVIAGSELSRVKAFFQWHLDNKVPVIFHNGICFDIPLCESLLEMDLTELMVIDTLPLSWYLNTNRKVHGLASFHEDYGIRKPEVSEGEWEKPERSEGQSDEDFEMEQLRHEALMQYRCCYDVRINVALWEDFKERLIDMYTKSKEVIDSGKVGGKLLDDSEEIYLDRFRNTTSVDEWIDNILTFLMMKQDNIRIKEKTKWLVDKPAIEALNIELTEKIDEAKRVLESVMPDVPKYTKRNFPKKPTKKGKKKGDPDELSASGIKWNSICNTYGKKNDLGHEMCIPVEGVPYPVEVGKWKEGDGGGIVVKVLAKYEPPNAGSPDQIKNFLFSHGWKPQTFDLVEDKDAMDAWLATGKRGKFPEKRRVPQISISGEGGKELCPSVLRLAEEVPEIMAYQKYTTIKHRRDMIKGWLEDMGEGTHLKAGCGGFTSTLREQHRGLVNLPSVDKPYGKEIRGGLIAPKGCILLGSDLSGLEDRVKHHFMLAHDPDYVATMMEDDYDAHITTAYYSKMITEEEFKDFKAGKATEKVKAARKKGKSTNYACLPVDTTEVLTKSGWKRYDEIRLTDEVLSLVGDEYKWNTITKVHFFEDEQLIGMGNSFIGWESTSDHRWLVSKRLQKGHRGERYYEDMYVETKDINSECNIYNNGFYNEGESKVTEIEAELVGWILSDGYYKWSELAETTSSSKGKKKGINASISQSKNKYYLELEDCLSRTGVGYSRDVITKDNGNDLYNYRLRSSDIRDFLDRVVGCRKDKHDVNWVQWILRLNRPQLEAFFHSFWLADGNTTHKVKEITQNLGNISEALMLCGNLLGMRVTYNHKTDKCIVMNFTSKRHITGQRLVKEKTRKTDVFCLTVPDGNFVMRQGQYITVTGNCVYGAMPPTIARSAGVPLEEGKQLYEGYWDLNWSVKAIAEEQVVIECSKGKKWLVNPVNGFCYSLRAEKDRFSALCQGTGSYFFDIWVDNIMTLMYDAYKVKRLNGEFHDEYISTFRDTPENRESMKRITLEALEQVNEEFLMRRKLGCDVQFGTDYSQIH